MTSLATSACVCVKLHLLSRVMNTSTREIDLSQPQKCKIHQWIYLKCVLRFNCKYIPRPVFTLHQTYIDLSLQLKANANLIERQKASLCKRDLKLSKAYFRPFYDGTHAMLIYTRGIFTHYFYRNMYYMYISWASIAATHVFRITLIDFVTNVRISNVFILYHFITAKFKNERKANWLIAHCNINIVMRY